MNIMKLSAILVIAGTITAQAGNFNYNFTLPLGFGALNWNNLGGGDNFLYDFTLPLGFGYLNWNNCDSGYYIPGIPLAPVPVSVCPYPYIFAPAPYWCFSPYWCSPPTYVVINNFYGGHRYHKRRVYESNHNGHYGSSMNNSRSVPGAEIKRPTLVARKATQENIDKVRRSTAPSAVAEPIRRSNPSSVQPVKPAVIQRPSAPIRTAPTYRSPNPTFRSPSPTYRSPNPTFRSPGTTYRSPSPTFRSPSPTFSRPQSFSSTPMTQPRMAPSAPRSVRSR